MDSVKSKIDNLSRPAPRTLFRSKWWEAIFDDEGNKKEIARSAVYVKPKIEGEIKGKLAIKAAKRARVKELKAAQAKKEYA